MSALIALALIFGGIGYTFEALCAGFIRTVIPGLPIRSKQRHMAKGGKLILSGIVLLVITVIIIT